jgi:uncharacterized SAM-binding protein YcdF (DUF218 family)
MKFHDLQRAVGILAGEFLPQNLQRFLDAFCAVLARRRSVIITSSFHIRRALATFRKRIPGIGFGVAGTRIGCGNTPQGKIQEYHYALIEVGKTLVY